MDGLVQKRLYSVANALELRAETRLIISLRVQSLGALVRCRPFDVTNFTVLHVDIEFTRQKIILMG